MHYTKVTKTDRSLDSIFELEKSIVRGSKFLGFLSVYIEDKKLQNTKTENKSVFYTFY